MLFHRRRTEGKPVLWALFALTVGARPLVAASEDCKGANQQRLDGVCVDQPIVNYVKCLQGTSHGQITTKSYDKSSGDKGLRVSGTASVGFTKLVKGGFDVENKNLSEVVKSAEDTFSNDVVKGCEKLASSPTPPPTGEPTRKPSSIRQPSRQPRAQTSPARDSLGLGIDHEGTGRNEAALAFYQRALDLTDRKYPEAAGRLGLLQYRIGSYRDAESNLQLALNNWEDPWVKANRTSLEGTLRQAGERRNDPEPVPDPAGSDCRELADLLLGRESRDIPLEQATDILRQTGKSPPDGVKETTDGAKDANARGYANYRDAMTHGDPLRLQRLRVARRELQQSVLSDGGRAVAHLNLAEVNLQLQEWGDALSNLKDCGSLKGSAVTIRRCNDFWLRLNRASCLRSEARR